MKNKKAQIDQLGGLITGVVAIGILLVIGFLIFSQTKDVGISVGTDVSIRANKTFTVDQFSYISPCVSDDEAMTVTRVINGSNATGQGIVLTSGNYTISGGHINVSDDGLDAGNGVSLLGTTIQLDYSCSPADYAYNSTTIVQNATQDIPGWIAIIVVTVIGALLVGLVTLFRKGQ